jgi:predicted Zn-dependent peptidase
MSSRLFLNIRERRGLAYDVHSFTQKHRDTGLLGVYLGVDPKNAVRAVNAVLEEMRSLCDQDLADEELERAKEFTKGRLRLELESTNGVSFWLAYQQLLIGSIKTIDDEIALIDAITADDVRRVANEVLRTPIQMAVIGPFAKDGAFRATLGA